MKQYHESEIKTKQYYKSQTVKLFQNLSLFFGMSSLRLDISVETI